MNSLRALRHRPFALLWTGQTISRLGDSLYALALAWWVLEETGSTTDPSFGFPTTAALARGRLLVVNAQFDKRGAPEGPALPFTVSSIKAP